MLNSLQNQVRSLSDNRQSGARNMGTLTGRRVFRNAVGLRDKVDFYSFTLTTRSSFSLSLTKLQNNVDVVLQGAGVRLSSKKGGRKSEAIASILEPGTYYVRVQQKRGNSRYQLTLNAASDTTPNPNLPSRRVLSHSSFFASTIGFVDLPTGTVTPLTVKGAAVGLPLSDVAVRGNDLFVTTYINDLFKIDATTGNSTLIGNLGFSTIAPAVTGLAFSPSGTLYATTIDFGSSPNALHTVDLTTGRASLVATFPSDSKVEDIAYDAATDRFIGVGRGASGAKSYLYSIGLGGDIQFLGATGFQNVQGLLFDNGNLYGFMWGANPQQLVFSGLRQGNYQGFIDKPSIPIPGAGLGAISGAG